MQRHIREFPQKVMFLTLAYMPQHMEPYMILCLHKFSLFVLLDEKCKISGAQSAQF